MGKQTRRGEGGLTRGAVGGEGDAGAAAVAAAAAGVGTSRRRRRTTRRRGGLGLHRNQGWRDHLSPAVPAHAPLPSSLPLRRHGQGPWTLQGECRHWWWGRHETRRQMEEERWMKRWRWTRQGGCLRRAVRRVQQVQGPWQWHCWWRKMTRKQQLGLQSHHRVRPWLHSLHRPHSPHSRPPRTPRFRSRS